uniref:Uncharacterized protein n=1 Tax=Anopheles culicifacies TaxID=139723 RepID=A0A182MMH6_9DIPT
MWYIILGLSVLINIANSVFVVEVNKLFKPCLNSNKVAPFPLDVSNVQVYLSEDERLIMNGELKFTQNINPPWGVSIYTHKLDHGEWLPTPYSRSTFNLCMMMLSNTEIWYPITRHMNQTSCPYRRGRDAQNGRVKQKQKNKLSTVKHYDHSVAFKKGNANSTCSSAEALDDLDTIYFGGSSSSIGTYIRINAHGTRINVIKPEVPLPEHSTVNTTRKLNVIS